MRIDRTYPLGGKERQNIEVRRALGPAPSGLHYYDDFSTVDRAARTITYHFNLLPKVELLGWTPQSEGQRRIVERVKKDLRKQGLEETIENTYSVLRGLYLRRAYSRDDLRLLGVYFDPDWTTNTERAFRREAV